MKYLFLLTGMYLCVSFLSCIHTGQDATKKNAASADYTAIKLPSFKTARVLYLSENLYNSITGPEIFDSLVSKKIIRGTYGFFTFLDSLGNPLSRNYDSLVLNKEQVSLLTTSLEKCYARNNPGFPKCGSAIKDAVVFYDSTGKPCGFIELAFECHVYDFSKSIQLNIDSCNTDSMMKKFVDLFNSFGIKREFTY